MAKKLVQVAGMDKVFAISGATYTTTEIKTGVTQADENSLLFITASEDDVDKWAGGFQIRQGWGYIWAKGKIYSGNEGENHSSSSDDWGSL